MIVHLVRHGEVENPGHVVYADLPGFGLSDRGIIQAEKMAAYLAARPVEAIWSSPLLRAAQTAGRVAAVHGLRVILSDALTEWGLSLRWKGVRWEDLGQRFPGEPDAYFDHPWDMPFSPESLHTLADRMQTAVERLRQAHLGEVVVVSHQDPLQAARLVLTRRDLRSFWEDKPSHCEVVTLAADGGWHEVDRWSPPDSSVPFPPPRSDQRLEPGS